jgi:hypothetical protein
MGVNLRTQAVIETAVYVDDLPAAETFSGTVLGLQVIGKEQAVTPSSRCARPSGAGGNPAPSSSHGQALPTTGVPPQQPGMTTAGGPPQQPPQP